jgi:hypothetical protein
MPMSEQADQSVIPEDWDPIFQVSADNAEQLFTLHPREFYQYLRDTDQRCTTVTYVEVICDLNLFRQKKIKDRDRQLVEDLINLIKVHLYQARFTNYEQAALFEMARTSWFILQQNPNNKEVQEAVRKGLIVAIGRFGKPQPVEEA